MKMIRRNLILVVATLVTGDACGQPHGNQLWEGRVATSEAGVLTGWVCAAPFHPTQPVVDIFINGDATAVDGNEQASWDRYRGPNSRADHLLGSADLIADAHLDEPGCAGAGWYLHFAVPRVRRTEAGPGVHRLHAAIRLPGGWQALTGSPVVMEVRGREEPLLPWADDFAQSCVRRKSKVSPQPPVGTASSEPSWALSPPIGECLDGGQFWVAESTNETRQFGTVHNVGPWSYSISVDLAGDPIPTAPWELRFVQVPAGGNRLRQVIDRRLAVADGTPLDAYTAAVLETGLRDAVDIGKSALFIELAFRLLRVDPGTIVVTDEVGGRLTAPFTELAREGLLNARWRITLGLVLAGGSAAHDRYLEVNLAASRGRSGQRDPREGSFDLCTARTSIEALVPSVPCERSGAPGGDETGLFDRRAAGTPIIYVDLAQLHRITGPRQVLRADAEGWSFARVPISTMVRNLPWVDRPGLHASLPLVDGIADPSGLTLRGIYMGTETWGPVRLEVELGRFRLYRFIAD
jgi:hypothetical protein